jgi:hypothetical protein
MSDDYILTSYVNFNKRESPNSYKILVIGDSLVDGLTIDNSHIEVHYGFTFQDFIDLDDRGIGLSFYLSEDNYREVVIVCGTNDIQNGYTINEILDNITILLNNYRIKITLCGILNQDDYNKQLEKYCVKNRYIYCDFYEDLLLDDLDNDGVHLNWNGKRKVSELFNSVFPSYY